MPGGVGMTGGWLLLAAFILPVGLSVLWSVRAAREWTVRFAPWAGFPALAIGLLHLVAPASVPPFEAPGLFLGMSLGVDPLGEPFFVLTALLWSTAGLFARSYHRDDPAGEVFFGFFTLTMAGNLGVVLAGDLLTFYLSFAVMTFAAYGLIVHRRDDEAVRAGRVYIVLALCGEALILPALFALGAGGGGVMTFGVGLGAGWEGVGSAAPLVAGLLIAGFGVKAGLVPLHLWLPLAHPVAPTAASALLSGAMIKAGLLGWLRVLPEGSAVAEGSGLMALGGALVVAGVVTAFYGVVVGIAQDDAKTVLAYSSVSQMGTMAVGVGIVLLAPGTAPLAVAAVALYAVHHGIAKGGLFLSVGVADRLPRVGEQGVPSSRWMGVLRTGVVLPSLALAGAPLTSGAMAKVALKKPLAELGGGWYAFLDPLLLGAAAGTALLMLRFVWTMEARVAKGEGGDRSGEGTADRGAVVGGVGGGDGGGEGGFSGLAASWGGLVLLGVAAPLWIGRVLALPGGVLAPTAFAGVGAALLPVLAGGLLGWVVWRRPGWLGPLAEVRVPPGDLLIPVLWVGRRLVPRGPRAAGAVVRGALDRALAFEAWVGRMVDRIAGGDLVLMRGPVLGGVLFGLALVLLLALGG